MIGGGGGGGANHSGGGGAGSYYTGTFTFLANTVYLVTIGASAIRFSTRIFSILSLISRTFSTAEGDVA
jgi:hypothetical protein